MLWRIYSWKRQFFGSACITLNTTIRQNTYPTLNLNTNCKAVNTLKDLSILKSLQHTLQPRSLTVTLHKDKDLYPECVAAAARFKKPSVTHCVYICTLCTRSCSYSRPFISFYWTASLQTHTKPLIFQFHILPSLLEIRKFNSLVRSITLSSPG